MKTSEAGIRMIKAYEGFSNSPYKDSAGLLTIGYGHLIKPGEKFTTISQEEAETLLKRDLATAETIVTLSVKVPLTQGQFDALVSFVFNLGGAAFKRSTLLKRLNAGDYEKAADNFQRWVFAKGAQLNGLVKRRAAEWALFTGGK